MYAADLPADQVFYHGTRVDLTVGDLMSESRAFFTS